MAAAIPWKALLTAALLAAGLAAYAPGFANEFVNYDDDIYITRSAPVRDGLSASGAAWAFTSFQGANWFPLTRLSWMLDAQVYGLSPRGFHATNLLFHLTNTLLLFAFFVRTTGSIGASAFVAAVFALHPLHVESVAWASARKDVLSTCFGLLALLAHERYVRAVRPRPWYAAVAGCLALALMAKPTAVVLPFLLLLLDEWPLRRLRRHNDPTAWDPARVRGALREKLPLFALVALAAVVTVVAQQSGDALQSLERYPLDVRIGNALVATLAYLRLAVLPIGLSVFYPHPGDTLSLWQGAGAALVLMAVTGLAFRAARHRPYLAVGWLWFLVGLAPVIGLVQVGQAAMADRYTYLPLVGLSWIVAFGALDLARGRLARSLLVAAALVATLALAGLTAAQVRTWRNSEALFRHALEVTERNHVAHINLGLAFLQQGRLPEAEPHLREAIAIAPRSAVARGLLGELQLRESRASEALESYRGALRIEPGKARWLAGLGNAHLERADLVAAERAYREGLERSPDSALLHANLALVQARGGHYEAALESYATAAALDPHNADTQAHLAISLVAAGQPERAIPHFERARILGGDRVGILVEHAGALQSSGRVPDAIETYEAALALAPDNVPLLNNLAQILITTNTRPHRALALAEKANDLTHHEDPRVLDTLAQAQQATQQPQKAQKTWQRALERAATTGDTSLAEEIQLRMQSPPQ